MNARNLLGTLSISFLSFLVACSDHFGEKTIINPESLGYEEDSQYEGFVKIKTNGTIVQLGTNRKEAMANEKPAMHVKLDYDFSIGAHEMTCDEFNQLMGEFYKGESFQTQCLSPNYPVRDVTFFDAVLAANAKSKKEHLDTAYSYNKAIFDQEGHCTNLDGFVFDANKTAFRLPTEAEWILSAQLNWSPKISWNADNSGYKVHEVCENGTDLAGFCDMSGNVMEWVNDWMGKFKDTLLVNFAGAPDGGSLGERILKGGSYRSDPQSIKTYRRGDIYTVTSSTRAEYVGFRLAYGNIPDATWLSHSGKATNNNIIATASVSTIESQIQTFKAKLAFRNELSENLVYINYAAGNSSIIEIEDTLPVYHPEISPNGKQVAFSTIPEGIEGKSSIFVRDLNENGSNLIKLNVESATIPRWRILPNKDTAIIYVNTAENNKDEGTFKSNSTWQVIFKYGKFGSPEKLFDGNYHGGVSRNNRFAVTGARLLRAHVDQADTIWYNGEQACNVSLAKDESKRTLFLDFAGKTGMDFVGESYRVHERILVMDSTGKLIQSVKAPEGYSFDHSEWVSSNLAIATLADINGNHKKIVLVNLDDNSLIDLVKGEELWHPTLWTSSEENINTTLDLDSAGQYFVDGGSEAALCLRNKMEIMWNHRNSKLAIVGSSRPLNGINPLLLDSTLDAINLANVPNSIFVSDFLFRNYILKQLKELQFLVVSLDIDMWWKNENSSYDNFFYLEYKNYPGFVYDENHNFWENEYPDGIAEASINAFNYEYFIDIYRDSRGFNGEPAVSWEAKPSVDYDSTWFDNNSEAYYLNLRRFESMLEIAEKNGITVIGVIFPMSPGYKNTGSFGRYGIRRSKAPKLIEEIANLSKLYPHFVFMDENKMGNHDYTDKMANNRDHLSIQGSKFFTARLDSLIKTLK